VGIGDGEWGMGDGGLGIGPNPQSPIPNPQSQSPLDLFILLNCFSNNNIYVNK